MGKYDHLLDDEPTPKKNRFSNLEEDMPTVEIIGETAPEKPKTADFSGVIARSSTTAMAPGEEQPGYGESAARGFKQGMSAGFSDELAGVGTAIGDRMATAASAPPPKIYDPALRQWNENPAHKAWLANNPQRSFGDVYREGRDEDRDKDEKARKANPKTFAGSEIGGALVTSMVPGLGGAGTAAKAASAGKAAIPGARALTGTRMFVEGSIGALGSSQADITKGEIGDAAIDTAFGGVTSTALGKTLQAGSDYVRRAATRRLRQLTQDYTKGAPAKAAKEFRKRAGDQVAKILDKDADLTDALSRSTDDATVIADMRLDGLAKQLRPVYDGLDVEYPTKLGDVLNDLRHMVELGLEQQTGKKEVKRAVLAEAADLISSHGAANEVKEEVLKKALKQFADGKGGRELDEVMSLQVPLQDVRRWVTKASRRVDRTLGGLNEGERYVIRQETADYMRQALDSRLKRIEIDAPDLAPQLSKMIELNRQINAYAAARDLFHTVAEKDMVRKPSQIAKLAGSAAGGMAGGVMGLGTGNPIPAIAGATLGWAAPEVGRRADRIATQGIDAISSTESARALANWFKSPGKETLKRAIDAGIPEGTIRWAAANAGDEEKRAEAGRALVQATKDGAKFLVKQVKGDKR